MNRIGREPFKFSISLMWKEKTILQMAMILIIIQGRGGGGQEAKERAVNL